MRSHCTPAAYAAGDAVQDTVSFLGCNPSFIEAGEVPMGPLVELVQVPRSLQMAHHSSGMSPAQHGVTHKFAEGVLHLSVLCP